MASTEQLVVIIGGTGFVGRALAKALQENGYAVRALSRVIPENAFQDATAVVNLAGEPVAQRWTKSAKEKIYNSRVLGTRDLVNKISGRGVQTLISASAIGYYGDQGDLELTESSPSGSDFLAGVCKDWEFENQKFSGRNVILRLGVIFGRNGGALEKMSLPFRYGIGSPLGSGTQWMSWIHIDDVIQMILWALKSESVKGVYNAVSPHPSTNLEVSRALADHYKKFLLPKAPAFILKTVLGEMSSFVLGSTKVIPKKAVAEGFKFRYSDLKLAIKDSLSR